MRIFAHVRVQPISTFTATLLVIANMIGTGIFTTSGYLYGDIRNEFASVFIWIVGGIVALCGAFCYVAIAQNYPRSGGEYHFLSVLYHPGIGFTAGIVSVITGFSAPIAASSLAFGKYFSNLLPLYDAKTYAVALILFLMLVHAAGVHYGARVQNFFTILKISLILLFLVIGFHFLDETGGVKEHFYKSVSWEPMVSSAFAIGLVYVSFAYSGWNAATYLLEEIKNPKRGVWLSLTIGTSIVMILYILLNYIFFTTTPAEQFMNKEDVGYEVAKVITGSGGAKLLTMLISVALISSVSSMIMAGPRVLFVMGEDYRFLRYFSWRSRSGSPVRAIVLQSLIAIFMVLTATFDTILNYIGLTLSFFTFLVVLGTFLPKVEKKPWGHPVTSLLFLAVTGWMIFHVSVGRWEVFIASLLTLGFGYFLYYFIGKRYYQPKMNKSE